MSSIFTLKDIIEKYQINHKVGLNCRCPEGAKHHLEQDLQAFIEQNFIPKDHVIKSYINFMYRPGDPEDAVKEILTKKIVSELLNQKAIDFKVQPSTIDATNSMQALIYWLKPKS